MSEIGICIKRSQQHVAVILSEGKEADRVISMLCKYICEQIGHPTLDSVWVTIYKGTDTKNCSVTLTNSGIIHWRLPAWDG